MACGMHGVAWLQMRRDLLPSSGTLTLTFRSAKSARCDDEPMTDTEFEVRPSFFCNIPYLSQILGNLIGMGVLRTLLRGLFGVTDPQEFLRNYVKSEPAVVLNGSATPATAVSRALCVPGC